MLLEVEKGNLNFGTIHVLFFTGSSHCGSLFRSIKRENGVNDRYVFTKNRRKKQIKASLENSSAAAIKLLSPPSRLHEEQSEY